MGAVDGPPRSALELAIAERNAVALGVSIAGLMDEAGRAIAAEVGRHVSDRKARIVILAGSGNNGGDGASAAHHLRLAGYAPELWPITGASTIRSIPARRAFERVAGSVAVHERSPQTGDLTGAALVVDALLGTGQAGPLRGAYREAVDAVNRAGVPVLSVDVPSGLGGTPSVRPRWTVTLSAPKVGLDASTGGEVVVRAIGIPDDAFDRTGPGEFLAYPTLGARGRSTRVAIVGGGPFTGAPALAALSALRAGAERATVYAPVPAAESIRALSPDLVVVGQGAERLGPSDVAPLLEKLRATRVDAVIIGMGLGRSEETLGAVRTVLASLIGTVPLVVDADALDAVPALAGPPAAPVVLTPNEGEFARVFGGTAAEDLATRRTETGAAAAARHVVVVRKGREDVIASPDRSAVSGPHPASANVGGSGDVLAGLLGRLLGAGVRDVHAARLAVQWLDGAARLAADRYGDGLLATDLIAELPRALLDGIRAAPLG